MQFLFPGKATQTANRRMKYHKYSEMLHDDLPWPVAGGYALGVQILTVGEGWKIILPQLIDMNDGFIS
jgi:hypothetical protein